MRTPERERQMAMVSAHYTLRKLLCCSVEDVMSRQGLDAPHAYLALEDLKAAQLAVVTDGVYFIANSIFEPRFE
jgi:hypothetical protein